MWTIRDNGSDVNWYEAWDYCASCEQGAYKDWRLPTYEELAGAYWSMRLTETDHDMRVAGPFKLSACHVWVNSVGLGTGGLPDHWSGTGGVHDQRPNLSFCNGILDISPRGDRSGIRALCVRRSGK